MALYFSDMGKRLLHLVNNKYGYTVLALMLYILILEETDLFTLLKYRADINDLREQKEYFEEEIVETRRSITELTTDQSALEKFAREQHYMKRADEDLFVILTRPEVAETD